MSGTFGFPLVQQHADLSLTICWFSAAKVKGPAIGDQENTTLAEFFDVFWHRREDNDKDGPCFVPARFQLEPDGKHVRRCKRNLLARTAVAMDVETNKETGEVPPSLDDAALRVRNAGLAAVLYSSHNHTVAAARYRIVLPQSGAIDPDLPAVEAVAALLQLDGVLDRSKVVASSLFYLPSCPPGQLDHHATAVIEGDPIATAWIIEAAGKILAARQAEADRIAAEAHAAAAARREARIAAGFDPDASLIDQIRARLDLHSILLSHGYDQHGTRYRHPNSSSGSYGADIKTFAGIERVYSHNSGDPLHGGNLPAWRGSVTALDAFDAVTILDYGGDRKKALSELAQCFGISKPTERKAVARLIYRMRDAGAGQEAIEAAAFAEGLRQGLSRSEVISVAREVVARVTSRRAA